MFSWDAAKALSNLKKHGVSFDEAKSVFEDPWVLDWHDFEHSEDEQGASAWASRQREESWSSLMRQGD